MFVACALVAPAAAAQAQEPSLFNGPGHWRLVVSPYSYHFNPSPEHEYVWAVGVERQSDNGWLYGGSYFSNSFGQPSGYAASPEDTGAGVRAGDAPHVRR